MKGTGEASKDLEAPKASEFTSGAVFWVTAHEAHWHGSGNMGVVAGTEPRSHLLTDLSRHFGYPHK